MFGESRNQFIHSLFNTYVVLLISDIAIKGSDKFIINVLRFKIRCCLEIKFAANLKYLSLLELMRREYFRILPEMGNDSSMQHILVHDNLAVF